MYKACLKDATGNYKKFSFLCPPGSSFNPAKAMCDIMFNVNCTDRGEREGKNVFSFAIKTMQTGARDSGDTITNTQQQEEQEEEHTVTKHNPKKARQLLPRI